MWPMACSDTARNRGREAGPRALAWRLGKLLALAGIAGASIALPLAASAGAGAATTQAGEVSAPAVLTVTSVSPAYAAPGATITIAGLVRNASGTPETGLSVQMWSSSAAFTSRSELESYAAGSYLPPQSPVGGPVTIARLVGGATRHWQIRIPASALNLNCFGVYPLSAVASTSLQSVGTVPIPLPFWPSAHGACTIARPRPAAISWIWPLIDAPQQTACPALSSNSLAASIAPGGRLATLLAVGRRYASSARLTWAIDPALLGNLRTMTRPYQVGGSADCAGATRLPASTAAADWLSGLHTATSGRRVFVTPYADVDVPALIGSDMLPDLRAAVVTGQRVASQVLGRSVGTGRLPSQRTNLSAVAWPPPGAASNSLLENLAAVEASTVILPMPPSPVSYTPGAVASMPNGVGGTVRVLLADSRIASLLTGHGTSASAPGSTLAISQLFLAETAMIIDEAPSIPRPILIAPPRRWDPSARLANSLLSDTVTAPWLRPTGLGRLASMPPEHVFGSTLPPQPSAATPADLPASLLRAVSALDRKVALLTSIRVKPDLSLSRAIFGIESSAWRSPDGRYARALLTRMSHYVASQLSGVSVHGVSQVTLGGKVSDGVPVSIRSTLGYPVRVRLEVTASNTSVRIAQPPVITLSPGQLKTLKLSVHASQNGSATIKLRLTSASGTPLLAEPFYMQIKATNLGTIALVICAAALAIFVIASAARAIRSGRPRGGQAAATGDRPSGGDGTDSSDGTIPGGGPVGGVPAGEGQDQGRDGTSGVSRAPAGSNDPLAAAPRQGDPGAAGIPGSGREVRVPHGRAGGSQ